MSKYERIFKHASIQSVYQTLYGILEKRHNEESRHTGFGHGFHRWVMSIDLRKKMNSDPNRQYQFSFKEIREMLKEMADRKLVEVKQNRGYGILEYSTLGWDDCQIKGDYFIETADV